MKAAIRFLTFSVFCAATAFAVPTPQTMSALQVNLIQLRSNNGFVLVSVFDDAKAFPKQADKAVVKFKVPASKASQITIPDLPAGEYAVAIAHDENDNGKVDMNFVGMPKEGFGFSRNAKVMFGPPSFDKAKFTVSGPTTSTQIKVKYF